MPPEPGQALSVIEQQELLSCTVSHFQRIAALNRFTENSTFDHAVERCLICRPGLIPADPFSTYLEVVVQSVRVRRPSLDQSLVDAINGDLELQGFPDRVSVESLAAGHSEAVAHWVNWLRDALDTGLGLLSVHSTTSRDFTIEEAEKEGFGPLIQKKIAELIAFQRGNR